jgi:hypothetical protein
MTLNIFRSSMAAALCAAVLFSMSPAATASDSYDGSDGSGDSHIDMYLAAGAAVLVGAILLWDVLQSGSRDQVEEAPAPAPVLETTGVDWASVDSTIGSSSATLAVAAGSPGLMEPAGSLLQALLDASPPDLCVLPDLLDLGGAGGSDAFGMARGFFGATRLVQVLEQAGSARVELLSAEGILWSGLCGPDFALTADSLLSALWNSPLRR